jgi:CHAT domain-containing protein
VSLPLILLTLMLAQAAPEEGLAACNADARTAPTDRDTWRCFYLHARRTGEWEEASARLNTVLEGAPDSPHVLLNLGHLHSDRGLPEATSLYSAAIAAYVVDEDTTGEVQARIALANFQVHQGVPGEDVAAAFRQASMVAQASGDPLLQATANAQQARFLWRTGEDYVEATRLLTAAEPHAFPDGPYQLKLLILHVFAGIYRATDRPEKGLDASRRLVALAVAEGDRYVEATARLNLADLSAGHPELVSADVALAESAAALAIAEAVGNPYAVAGAACIRARTLDIAGRSGSLALWTRCAEGFAALEDPLSETLGLLGLAGALSRTDPTRAVTLTETAARKSQATGQQTAEIHARFAQAVLSWEAEGADAGQVAFVGYLDALEQLREGQTDDDTRAMVTSAQADGHHHLASRLAWSVPEGLSEAIQVVEQLRAHELNDDDAPTHALSLPALQANLQEGEALLSYQLPRSQDILPSLQAESWAVLITTDQITRLPLPNRASLKVAVTALTGFFPSDDAAAAQHSPVLFKQLLAPALEAAKAPITRLIIVPDGPLHRLPFAALRAHPDAPPFGEQVALSRAPSLTAWLALSRRSPLEVQGPAWIFADPFPLAEDDLPRLPAARSEARTLARHFGRATKVYTGSDATEAVLTERSPPPRLLHFAAHARVSSTASRTHAILLATTSRSDGRLLPDEIAALSLTGSAVVLSACRSADGEVLEFDGVRGLSRAFLVAGADVVVGSLWPVSDDAAARFMTPFAASLATGTTIDEALKAARTDRRLAEDSSAAWAGFIATGNGKARPWPDGAPRSPQLPLVLVGSVVLMGGLFWRWKKRTQPR